MDTTRLFEHVHGHVGWLAAAVLIHPGILLRRPERRAHLAVGLATAFVTVAAALGAWLYVPYRARLKQGIFVDAPVYGLLFERKEHLAFAAVLFAWAGAAAYFGGRRTIALRSFAASATLATSVAALGTVVASYRSF
jgi:hypothetical protein